MADYIKQAEEYVANYNPNETINLNDQRLTNVETARNQATNQVTNTYNNMINQADKFYNDQINIAKQYSDTQIANQNAQTEQAIKEINQQRDKAQREYNKEQRGAYQDYRTQIDPYGINAEVRASKGLNNSGYSETSNVAMYNAYQNRVATARQSLSDAMTNYDNMIAQARLSNNTTTAELAFKFAQQQAELALQGFQYKNDLLGQQQAQLNTVNSRYDSQYNNMLNLLENELSNRRANYNTALNTLESYRNFEYQKEKDRRDEEFRRQQAQLEQERWQKEYELSLSRLNSSRSSGGSSRRSSGGNNDNVYTVTDAINNPATTSLRIVQEPGSQGAVKFKDNNGNTVYATDNKGNIISHTEESNWARNMANKLVDNATSKSTKSSGNAKNPQNRPTEPISFDGVKLTLYNKK